LDQDTQTEWYSLYYHLYDVTKKEYCNLIGQLAGYCYVIITA